MSHSLLYLAHHTHISALFNECDINKRACDARGILIVFNNKHMTEKDSQKSGTYTISFDDKLTIGAPKN